MKTQCSPLVRRLVSSTTLLIVCVALGAHLRAGEPEWSKQQKEVWSNVETYWKLDSAGDTQNFLTYFHADYQGWNYGNVLPGSKDRAVKFITHSHQASKTLVYDIQPVTVRVHGNIAYAHYLFTRVIKDAEGKEKREAGRWTDILMKEGNKWVMIADHGGEFPPKP
jgi:ketosteroid isomerase-like protein